MPCRLFRRLLLLGLGLQTAIPRPIELPRLRLVKCAHYRVKLLFDDALGLWLNTIVSRAVGVWTPDRRRLLQYLGHAGGWREIRQYHTAQGIPQPTEMVT